MKDSARIFAARLASLTACAKATAVAKAKEVLDCFWPMV